MDSAKAIKDVLKKRIFNPVKIVEHTIENFTLRVETILRTILLK